jgi:hypothetical protein
MVLAQQKTSSCAVDRFDRKSCNHHIIIEPSRCLAQIHKSATWRFFTNIERRRSNPAVSQVMGLQDAKGYAPEELFNASAGNRTRGWPTLSEEDLLMATANFTTKPPMLDGDWSNLGVYVPKASVQP